MPTCPGAPQYLRTLLHTLPQPELPCPRLSPRPSHAHILLGVPPDHALLPNHLPSTVCLPPTITGLPRPLIPHCKGLSQKTESLRCVYHCTQQLTQFQVHWSRVRETEATGCVCVCVCTRETEVFKELAHAITEPDKSPPCRGVAAGPSTQVSWRKSSASSCAQTSQWGPPEKP